MTGNDRAGVLVIGDELLCGSRRDRHLAHVIEALARRGMRLAWCTYAGDELPVLVKILQHSRTDGFPVLCFGGIGATPDDRTRQAAARAFGRPLARHPQALRLIEARFGAATTAARLRMAELPAGCRLIGNPVNGIPGFSLEGHYFLPGFPQLAWPMLEGVLAQCGRVRCTPGVERAVRVGGVAESELVELMETLAARHPRARLYSLPQPGERRGLELGFRGEPGHVDAALAELVAELTARGLPFERVAPGPVCA